MDVALNVALHCPKDHYLHKMVSVDVFTPIIYLPKDHTPIRRFIEVVDSYFYLGGKCAVVIDPEMRVAISQDFDPPSYLVIALKVVSYFTLFLPMIMLSAKIILRIAYNANPHLMVASFAVQKNLGKSMHCIEN